MERNHLPIIGTIKQFLNLSSREELVQLDKNHACKKEQIPSNFFNCAYQKDTKERVEAEAKLNKTTNEGCVLESECLTSGKTLHQSADQ